MSSEQEIRLLNGVMDSVTINDQVAPGNYRDMFGIRNSISKNTTQNAASALRSFLKIANPYLPVTGTHKHLGSYEDVKGQSIIYFLYNSDGYHGIYRWYHNRPGYLNGVVEKILQVGSPFLYTTSNPSPLNFHPDHLITHVNLVNDDLYFVSRGQPLCVNIFRANETGKRKRYNLYLSEQNFYQTTYYILTVYNTAGPSIQQTINVTSTSKKRSERIQDFKKAIASNNFFAVLFTVVDKEQYLQLTLEVPTADYITIEEYTDNDPVHRFISSLVPDNFYPDKKMNLFDTPVWDLLKDWTLKASKSPPTYAPKAKYITSYDLGREAVIFAHAATGIQTINISAPATYYINIGSDNDSTGGYYDKTGTFSTGLSTVSTFAATPPNSFWAFNLNRMRVKAKIKLNISINFVNGGGQFIGILNAQGSPSYISVEQVTIPQTGQFVGQVELNADLDFGTSSIYPQLALIFTGIVPGSVVEFQVLDGTIQYDTAPLINRLDINQPYLFRAQYIYYNYQQSVLGTISSCPKPFLYTENAIEVDFTDYLLEETRYNFLIRNVVLCCSKDNGLTWSEFKRLEPYEFVGKGNQKYVFSALEQLIPIASSASLLSFHNLPVEVDTQDFADNRMFYGATREGYDKININIKLTDRYLPVTDPLLYPSASIKDAAIANGNIGLFWKRGWQGRVELAYYDIYDRITPVCTGDGGKVKIRFYSETDPATGALQSNHAALLDWEINHEPPKDAVKYQWVRTDNNDIYLVYTPICRSVNENFSPALVEGTIQVTNASGSGHISNIIVDGVNIIDSPVFVVTTNENNLAITIAETINASTPATGPKYTATAVSDVVYIHPESLAYTIEGKTITIGSTGGSTFTTTPFSPTGLTPAYIELDVSALAQYNNQGNKLSFTYEEGDYVRFIKFGSTGAFVDYYHEFRIVKVIGPKAYIKIDPDYPVLPGVNLVEFFSPNDLKADDYIYREFGECYLVKEKMVNGITRRYHEGPTQNQDYGGSPLNIDIPAKGTFGYGSGNAFIRELNGNVIQRKTFVDTTDIEGVDNGRVNSDALLGRQIRDGAFRFSNQYITSTRINGLNAFEPANQKQFPSPMGKIAAMKLVNNDILKIIFDNSMQLSIYVKQGVIQQTQNAGRIISLSDVVAGDSYIIERTIGTSNAESMAVNDESDLFGWDENEGVVFISQSNGLVEVSDVLMKNRFNEIAIARRLLNREKSQCPAVFDLYYNELIQTFGALGPAAEVLPSCTLAIADINNMAIVSNVSIVLGLSGTVIYSGPAQTSMMNLVAQKLNAYGQGWHATLQQDGSLLITSPLSYDGNALQVVISYLDNGTPKTKTYQAILSGGKPASVQAAFPAVTYAFSKEKKGWVTRYPFTPEGFGRLENQVVSFASGELWLHDQGVGYNNFYGVDYIPTITMVFNKDFPAVKRYKGICLWGIGSFICPEIIIPPFEGNASGMLSELRINHFSTIEGGRYAAFKMNKLTKNKKSIDDAWVNGHYLRGQSLIVNIALNDSNYFILKSVDISYFHSQPVK